MGALLKSTCTTFLKTLEECMQIANAAFSSELLYHTPTGSPLLALRKLNKLKLPNIFSRGVAERQMELKNCENGTIYAHSNLPEQTRINNLTPVPQKTGVMDSEKTITGGITKDVENKLLRKGDNQEDKSLKPVVDSINKSTPLHLGEQTDRDFPTFFSAMSIRFSDIKLLEDGGIPTGEFLQSCYEVVPVLDKLGSTVFAPVKMDFEGNIKKINQKYLTNKEEFSTLQKLILHEVSTEEARVRHSATEALLWLRRGLKFLKAFLTELRNGEKNIQTALNNAYGRTLRQHHGWVVRGVFALALKASPTYEGFLAALCVDGYDPRDGAFLNGMQRDLDSYLPAMEKQLGILDTLYEEYGLERDEVV
ncbi:pleckstrin homology domain-containing family A member 8 isoform X2 [Elgaria multicarinata webbii]